MVIEYFLDGKRASDGWDHSKLVIDGLLLAAAVIVCVFLQELPEKMEQRR